MPLYDYECEACGEREERWFAVYKDAPAEDICISCGSHRRRLVGIPIMWGPATVFDGDGNPIPGPGRAPLPASEIWAGTPLEGTDGRNPCAEPGDPAYVEPKPFVDVGK